MKKKTVSVIKSRSKQKKLPYPYLGVALGLSILLLAFFLFSSDTSAVKGASTSTKQQSFFEQISILFSQLFQPTQKQTYIATSEANLMQETVTTEQLLRMAGNKYVDGEVPLGDSMYSTDGPRKGYIYLCNSGKEEGGGGAESAGPWIVGNHWNPAEKITISGSVSWSNAQFSHTISGSTRTLVGNDLPISHTTGIFPVQPADPAYNYDRNPNTISAQTFRQQLPLVPTYSLTPYCMGGEVGIMLSGVALFNGFDASHRDAPAYEVQDSCDGHPQVSGEYHYHSLSRCMKDTSVQTVLGFALDGFPITGPKVADNKYLTTENLDECHGITSEIILDGKKTVMYHYVMTQDFPYSVSCFRAKPVSLMVTKATDQKNTGGMNTGQRTNGANAKRQPPKEAFIVCSGKTTGDSCSFSTPREMISGTCETPPAQTDLVCVPSRP